MRPTAMQRSMDKAGGKSPVPPTLPKHSTTVTVVCNGVRSSTSSPLTSPVKSRRSGDFTQMLDDRVEVRTDSSTHRTSVTVNETKRKAPPPPLSPRDKNGTTNVNFSSLPSPKSQSVVTVPPVKPKPTPAPLLTTQQPSATPSAKSESAPPPPSAKSPRSACSVPNTPLIRSSAPPPLLPRSNSMASSGGVVTLAIKSNDHHSNGGAYSNDSGTYNSAGNAYPDNTSASSKSGALNSGKTKSDAFNTAETDFFASLPSLPPDDYISPPTKHVSSSTSYKTAPVAEKSVSDSSYFSLSSSASSSPANARTERSAQSHSSYSSIPSSPASSDKSAVSSNASSPALSLKYSSVPCFPTSPTLGEASVSFSVSSAHRPTSGATRTGQKAAVSGASSADFSSPVPSGSLAVFNSSGPAAPSADPRSATSTVERKAASTTIIVNKGPALPAAAPAAPNKSAKTSDSDRSSPSSSSSSSSYPEPHPHTNLQSHHHHNQHPAPPTPPTPPPPAVARKPAAAVVSRPPSMTGIAENGSFMEEKEEAEYGGQSGMAGGEEDQHKEVFYVNMQAGCTNGVAAGTCGTETEATFAGRRDVKDVQTLSERQIVSSKGTVRGFKNRVRAGIVTFIEQPFSKIKEDAEESAPVFNYRVTEKGKIVVYTTSMTVVRETHERCKASRNILQTHMVRYEERDLYMSHEHQRQLKERLEIAEDTFVPLPQIFFDGLHLGGANDLEKLNESGQLRKLLQSFTKIQVRTMCKNCGGYRFVPCMVCHGSKKSVHRNNFTEEFCALRCMHCNENGLQRCQECVDQQE